MAAPARNPLLFDQSGIELPLEFLLTFSIPKRPGETQEEYSQRFQKAKQARDELSERIHAQAHLNAGSEPLSIDERVKLSMRVTKIASKTCSLPSCGRGIFADGTTLLKCARCQGAMYCGREHQKAHWSLHKPDCGQMQL